MWGGRVCCRNACISDDSENTCTLIGGFLGVVRVLLLQWSLVYVQENWFFTLQVARRCWSGNIHAKNAICKAMEENPLLKVTIPTHVEDLTLLDKALKSWTVLLGHIEGIDVAEQTCTFGNVFNQRLEHLAGLSLSLWMVWAEHLQWIKKGTKNPKFKWTHF